jgi:hypothetical protein
VAISTLAVRTSRPEPPPPAPAVELVAVRLDAIEGIVRAVQRDVKRIARPIERVTKPEALALLKMSRTTL